MTSPSLPHQQKGAALAVGLFFLLILTIVGLTAVRMTTQQGRMAASYQFQNTTFQGAESAIRGVVAEIRDEIEPPSGTAGNLLVEAISKAVGEDPPARQFAVGTGVTSGASIRYVMQAPAPGYSLGVGAGSIVAHRFEIDAQSTVSAANAQAEHLQGVERIGPGF